MRFLPCLLALTFAGGELPAQSPTDWPALVQKPYAEAKIPDLGLQPLLVGADGAIKDQAAWETRRKQLTDAWLTHLGPLPKRPEALDVREEAAEKLDGHQRRRISFLASDGDRIAAYLLTPADIKPGEPRPAVVVFHSTTNETLRQPVGLGADATKAIGLHLVNRGYVVLAPECYIMKDGGPKLQAAAVGKQWPSLTGLGKMVFDASRCVDLLESQPAVDAKRIGCIGHSLGAKEVLYAMAFEPRYRAGVFNEGGIGLRMSNWTDPWYLTEQFKPRIPEMEHHQLLALCAPRPLLVLGGDSADGDASWPFIHAALPVYQLLGASERIGLVNHRGGHSFPQSARKIAYRWLDDWLHHHPASEDVGPER